MAHAPAIPSELGLEEYWALVERGVLSEAKVELIDGQVRSMSPQGPEHKRTVRQLMVLLGPALEELEVQMPLKLTARSAPEPDLALTRSLAADAAARDTARLVVEVVWTQWQEALRKLPVYAEAGVSECWIVDVPQRQVLVHDQPAGRAYGRTRTFAGDDVLTPPGTDIRFTAADVFAPLDR